MQPPAWTELTVQVPQPHTEAAEAIALMAAPYGIYTEDYSDLVPATQRIAHSSLIDSRLLAQDRTQVRIHLFLSPEHDPAEVTAWLTQHLSAAQIPHSVQSRPCKTEDWQNNWKAYFHPLPIGQSLLIQPAWEPLSPAAATRKVLWLEPGLAFGSGAHATTQLCLVALEPLVCPGTRVLDVGCGSGILSVAAALLGAAEVLGIDIDPMAVHSAEQNAARNGLCPPQCAFAQGDLLAAAQGRYPLVLSNLVADLILGLAPQVGAVLAPDGVWLSSGILAERAPEVVRALQAAGWQIVQQTTQDGWVCLAAKNTSQRLDISQ